MKYQFSWVSALTLAMTLTPQVETIGATNGVIFISTRAPQDTQFGTEYYTDEKGPGMATLGDVAMASLLHDNGYTCRLILDRLLGAGAAAIGQDPATFLVTVLPDFSPKLIIMSGSGASADTPPPPPGVPVMMGEHVCLGNNAARPGSIYMYNGTDSNDPNQTTGAGGANRYMKVLAPNHPIMQGIPLDAQGRVKIFREPYPEEDSHVPPGGKSNYEYRWCTQNFTNAAPCTTVLGVLAGDTTADGTNRVCFAVADTGKLNAKGEVVTNRLVHMFMNEQGSGGPRRVFNALTEIGRVLFVRSAKWAMGETLQPYPGFKILDVTATSSSTVRISWEGTVKKNYSLLANDDLKSANWRTVVEDIRGVDGVVTRTFDISAGPQALFMKIRAVP